MHNSFIKTILTLVSSAAILAIFNIEVIAANKAYIYGSGKVFVIDVSNNMIDKKLDLPDAIDIKRVQTMTAFSAANALIIKDEYNVYAVNSGTMALIKKLDIDGQYARMILSPDKKNIYIFWQPVNASDYMMAERTKLTIFDEMLRAKPVPEIQFDGIIEAIDFSIDGNKLYIIYHSNPWKIQVIDISTKKILREISFDNFGRKTKGIFNKIALDMRNNKILISEMDKQDRKYKYVLYVYDIEANKISKQIEIEHNAGIKCKLLASTSLIICDEGIEINSREIRSGTMHVYDISRQNKIGLIKISNEPLEQNDFLGISPDEKKLYYRSSSGMQVIDMDRRTIIKTLDIPSYADAMTFD